MTEPRNVNIHLGDYESNTKKKKQSVQLTWNFSGIDCSRKDADKQKATVVRFFTTFTHG